MRNIFYDTSISSLIEFLLRRSVQGSVFSRAIKMFLPSGEGQRIFTGKQKI